MTHVKVVNKKSGLTQIITRANYRNIQESMPRLLKDLELINECDEFGKSEAEVRDEEKRASENRNPVMQEVKETLKQEVENGKKQAKKPKSGQSDDGGSKESA